MNHRRISTFSNMLMEKAMISNLSLMNTVTVLIYDKL